jgi:hypothetical protein
MQREKAIKKAEDMITEINDFIEYLDPMNVNYKSIDLPEGVGFAVNSLEGARNCLRAAVMHLTNK